MGSSSSGNGVIETKERKGLMKLEIPFTLKVGQVFTGFGIGCGLGIGVGRPLNLGAIPVLNQVMVATRGATDAFSGLQRHVNSSLRKVGANNIEAGVGCGVGFGHGFGVGLALKPRVLHQIQLHVFQAITGVMTKLGIGSTLPLNQNMLPSSLQTGMGIIKEPGNEIPDKSFDQLVKSVSKSRNEGNIVDVNTIVDDSDKASATKTGGVNRQYSSRTETVIDNFLRSPLLKEEGSSLHEQGGPQQLETSMLQMVLKHQILIDELMQENEKLRQILVRELKAEPNMFQSSFTSRFDKYPCTECFECRRRQRKR